MPSSSLVEVGVGGEVEVGVEQKYVPQIRSKFTFLVGWGGWRFGEYGYLSLQLG